MLMVPFNLTNGHIQHRDLCINEREGQPPSVSLANYFPKKRKYLKRVVVEYFKSVLVSQICPSIPKFKSVWKCFKILNINRIPPDADRIEKKAGKIWTVGRSATGCASGNSWSPLHSSSCRHSSSCCTSIEKQ